MKRILILMTLFSLISLMQTLAQSADSRGTASVEINGKKISIEYGRPQLNGRDMLGQAYEGMVWRMGMNQATTLTTEATLQFGDQTVAAGKYLLVAQKKGPRDWELIVNSDPSASANTRNTSQDVARIPLAPGEPPSSVETFTIELTAKGAQTGNFSMSWGDLIASADFQVK